MGPFPYSLRVSYVRSKWRLGGSFNLNQTDFGDRQMQNIFAGLKTGRVAWLAEINFIMDEGTPTGDRESWVSFLEANFAIKKGHNLKLTYEYYDPDIEHEREVEHALEQMIEQEVAELTEGYEPAKFPDRGETEIR